MASKNPKKLRENRMIEILLEIEKPNYELFMLYASPRYPSVIVQKCVEFI